MPIPIACRLTIDKSKEEIMALFQSNPRYTKGIVCEETATRAHLHCFFYTTDDTGKNARQNLKNFLKAQLKVKDNAMYSIKDVSADHEKLKSYTVKSGNFCYYGFTDDEIQAYVEKSYDPEKKKKTYQEELKDLNEAYWSDTEMTLDRYIEQFIELRFVKYSKPMSRSQMQTYLEYVQIRKDPVYKQGFIQRAQNVILKFAIL